MVKYGKFVKFLIPLSGLLLSALLFASSDPVKSGGFINLGFTVNSEGDDYSPSITADGSTMVFNSRMAGEKSHNIFICRNQNGFWGKPEPVYEVNTEYNEETPFISSDGKTLLFASDRPGGILPPMTADGKKRITYDIYISRFAGGTWSRPELLKGAVNTTMNERCPGLSTDGKKLFFTRWPYNNIKKSRIYMAELEDGQYVNARELPPSISSGNCEMGLRPSYRTPGKYYFASMRRGGFGGWDIYYTTYTGREFTSPVNAGGMINGPYGDMFYSESAGCAVISSDRPGGLGGYDIYSTIPSDKYSVPDKTVKKSSVDPEKVKAETPVYRKPLRIFFAFGSSAVKQEYAPALNKLAEYLRDNPGSKITITGHADPRGTRKYNTRLSRERGTNVMNFLKNSGVDSSRMTIRWHGKVKTSSCKYRHSYRRDRRVVIVIR